MVFFLLNAKTKEFHASTVEEIVALIPKLPSRKMKTFEEKQGMLCQESMERAKKILELKPNHKESYLIFQIIYNKYYDKIDPLDYTITLMGNKSEIKIKYSIIDLCLYLVSEKKSKDPSENKKNKRLFRFISEELTIPKILIHNEDEK